MRYVLHEVCGSGGAVVDYFLLPMGKKPVLFTCSMPMHLYVEGALISEYKSVRFFCKSINIRWFLIFSNFGTYSSHLNLKNDLKFNTSKIY